MIREIKEAAKAGDSLGGVVEVLGFGIPPGLGSHVHWDLRIDGLIAQALMSIQAMKAVEIGEGLTVAGGRGSAAHDAIAWAAGAPAYRGVGGGWDAGAPLSKARGQAPGRRGRLEPVACAREAVPSFWSGWWVRARRPSGAGVLHGWVGPSSPPTPWSSHSPQCHSTRSG